jgi:flagellar protein FliL
MDPTPSSSQATSTPGTEPQQPAAVAAVPPAAPPKRSKLMILLAILVPAVASAGASFASARAAVSKIHGPPEPHSPPRWDPRPPGPTMSLEPFLVTVPDNAKKAHAMKLTVAVEFEATVKDDALKAFTPRVRDAMLSQIRTLTYEGVTDPTNGEKMRAELLARCHGVGALAAERVLITDMVVQ